MGNLLINSYQKSSIFNPENRGDIYAKESLYFSELRENEIWDMKQITQFSLMQFSLLLFRSYLYFEKYATNLKLINLNTQIKKTLTLSGFTHLFNTIDYETFIPYSLDLKFKPVKFSNSSPFSKGSSLKFSSRDNTGKKLQISGGLMGIPSGQENEIFTKIYQKLNSYNAMIYFRTNENSILKLGESDKNNRQIFTQKKNSIGSNFIFYYISLAKTLAK